MKLCKVEIIKRFNNNICTNIYPVGYNANKINIIAYDEYLLNEGDNIGYCIGIVSDDFSFTDKMTEIDRINADTFIDARADVEINPDFKEKFSSSRKQMLTNARVV